MSRCLAARVARSHSRRTALWETQWGQLNGPGPPDTPCVLGAFGRAQCKLCPFLVTKLRPLVGSSAWVSTAPPRAKDSYLVDSASSHMLVSKIKPCMSKYKQLYRETANGSLNQLSFI